MEKLAAVLNIYRAYGEKHRTRTGEKRLVASLEALDLSQDDLAIAMRHFDYWDSNNIPYPFITRSRR